MIYVLMAVLAVGRVIAYERPPLTDYQLAAFFNPARTVIIEGTTKTGKNHAGLAWFFEQAAVEARAMNYWWAEPVYLQAEVSYDRLKRAIPEDLRQPNDSEKSLTLANGRKLWFKSMEKPDNLYGEDVGAAVINEASRGREESWWAIRSTLTATLGPVRIMGNLKGKKNWFYRMARRIEAGEADAAYFKFISAQAVKAGIFPESEIASARRDLPEAVFNELYLGEPNEDGSNPFGLEYIAGNSVADLAEGPAICFGVDLAKSFDYTSIKGLNAEGELCVSERFQMPWAETKARIRKVCGKTPTLVDSTGVGDPVLEDLQRAGGGNYTGFHFSQRSKQQLIEGLAVAVQQGATTILDGVHRMEMESFEYQYTRTGVIYAAPEGMHDDEVCAHALAWSHFHGGSKASKAWRVIT